MKAWMRAIKIVFRSSKLKKQFVYGTSDNDNDELNISCSVYKYMSALKDTATIKIKNLTYNEITQLIIGEFYDVEIWCGYRKGNVNKIFTGGVLYISNKLEGNTNTAIILCASNLVAKYGQKRLNLTLNSGINLYSAINFICKRAGITNSNVSTQFKKQFLDNIMTVNDTTGSWLDKLCSNNSSYIMNSDGITNATLSIFDSAKSNSRVIKLKNSDIQLTNGYPRLTSEGLSLTLLPTFNFMCGDTIEIDNSIIDISVSNQSEISKNYGGYFSQKGQYMIYEMVYVLQNRGAVFTLEMKCKNRDRISAYVGG